MSTGGAIGQFLAAAGRLRAVALLSGVLVLVAIPIKVWLALRAGLTGLAWGMVPCGMVYGALPLALLAGNTLSGALVMGVFGLGTLPNLLVISGLSGHLRQWSRRPLVRKAAAVAVIGFGLLGVARAVLLPESLAAHGFCLVY